MKFEIRVWSVLALLVLSTAACSSPTEDEDGDMSAVACPAGESPSPITGECMAPRMDMDTTPDDMMTQDMNVNPVEDMGRDQAEEEEDMSCENGQVFNPTTGLCEEPVGEDMGEDMAQDAGQDMTSPDDMGGEFGVLVGHITRSKAPSNGGVGPVYVALFERNPITASTSGSDPGLVAFQRIDTVDFNPEGTRVPYRLEGIPPRAEQYFITAFLDDNMNADMSDPMSAGPDRGDLISLEGIGPIKVTVDMAGEVMLDLDLNFSMLF